MSSKLYVVVGGQYGSEGKGAVAGRICADLERSGGRVIGVRVGGPNAGHTVIGRCPKTCFEHTWSDHEEDAHPWRLRQVPVSAVTAPESLLVIAAGSEVDPDVLADEVRALDSAGYGVTARLVVDGSATVLHPHHIDQEKTRNLSARIGSTAKGIGAARAERVWREAQLWSGYIRTEGRPDLEDVKVGSDTGRMLTEALRDDVSVVIEGTQGYGLGLHTEAYPQVTSGDCRAIDFLAQAGVSPWQTDSDGWGLDPAIVVCYRPYPIRVAGNSGRLRGETTWEALSLPVEKTTVTQKVRRVGTWDPELAAAAWRANGGPRGQVVWAALTMMDSVDPEISGMDESGDGWDDRLASRSVFLNYLADIGAKVSDLAYVGTGPDTALINERMYQ